MCFCELFVIPFPAPPPIVPGTGADACSPLGHAWVRVSVSAAPRAHCLFTQSRAHHPRAQSLAAGALPTLLAAASWLLTSDPEPIRFSLELSGQQAEEQGEALGAAGQGCALLRQPGLPLPSSRLSGGCRGAADPPRSAWAWAQVRRRQEPGTGSAETRGREGMWRTPGHLPALGP